MTEEEVKLEIIDVDLETDKVNNIEDRYQYFKCLSDIDNKIFFISELRADYKSDNNLINISIAKNDKLEGLIPIINKVAKIPDDLTKIAKKVIVTFANEQLNYDDAAELMKTPNGFQKYFELLNV